jgi:hypothetical protein
MKQDSTYALLFISQCLCVLPGDDEIQTLKVNQYGTFLLSSSLPLKCHSSTISKDVNYMDLNS